MGKPFCCKLGNHSYHYIHPNFTKICKLCGHKFDPNNKTIIEDLKHMNREGSGSRDGVFGDGGDGGGE